jgi:hypothetical protein
LASFLLQKNKNKITDMKLNKRIWLMIPVLALAISSCKKGFLDVNNDPNRVTDKNITPDLLFPQAANAAGVRTASGNWVFVDNWMGYWAASGSFAIDQRQTTYNLDFPFGDPLWQNHYNVLFDLHLTKYKAEAKGDSVLAGAAMILSTKLWQELVDVFGNIPYSQAFRNDEYRQPAYDRGVDVYNSLLKKLDTAISYMQKTAKGSFGNVDIVNQGNQIKWIKFANTLRLRLLIRQSQTTGFNPAAEIAKITANGGVLQSGETIFANPGYVNETNKQSPFYANFGFTPTGTEANTLTRANSYFVGLLNSTNDPRLPRYFKPPTAGGSIIGCDYGLSAGNPDGAHSSGIGPGLANNAAQSQWIFTSVESLFLEAEAIARGWLPGSAQTKYEDAVRESFIFLGVPNAVTAANAYIAANTIANWANAGATVLSQAKFITYQKYIALAGIDPVEAWSDLRRLNMIPNNGYISVNPAKVSNTLPVRLLYPQSEYTTNSENVNAEGTINAFTSKIFWQP